jgi:hypothetical protein
MVARAFWPSTAAAAPARTHSVPQTGAHHPRSRAIKNSKNSLEAQVAELKTQIEKLKHLKNKRW